MAGELQAMQPAEAEAMPDDAATVSTTDAPPAPEDLKKKVTDAKAVSDAQAKVKSAVTDAKTVVTDAGVKAAQKKAMPSQPPAPSKAATTAAFAQFKGSAQPVEARANARRGGVM